MNFVVVGLGSMGRRRIRILKKISDDIHITGIDGRIDRRRQAEDEFQIATDGDLVNVLKRQKPDCAVISTSPLSHAALIETCLKYDCHVFSELNLVNDGYETIIKLARDKGKILFLSSTPLYRAEIKYIISHISKNNSCVNYFYHVGQYLPDWHPWEPISDYFVSDKKTNGCRELFAVELPWIIKAFGEICSFEVISDNITGLPISFKDNYLLVIRHSNGNKGVLGIDVVSRKAVCNLEVYGENIYITWDGTPYGLSEYDFCKKRSNTVVLYNDVDKSDKYASIIIENAYQNELSTFLDLVNGEGRAEYSFEEDQKVLELIDRIEMGGNK